MTNLYDRLDQAEFNALLQLAAWQVHRFRHDDQAGERLEEVVQSLMGDLSRPGLVLDALREIYADENRQALLDEWEMSRHIGSEQAWYSDARLIYRFTVTLLLLRAVSKDLVGRLTSAGVDEFLRSEVRSDLDTILGESERWRPIVGHDLEDRADRLRSALDEAQAADQARERREVAEAPVSAAAVRGFASEVRGAYCDSHPLLGLDLVEIEADEDAYGPLTRGIRELLPKSWFIGDWDLVIGIEHYGRELARDETEAIGRALATKAESVDPAGTVTADLLATIDHVRERGYEPDIAMVGEDVYARAEIFRHPAFAPAHDLFNGMGLGRLDGVPVLPVRGADPTLRVAANLGAALSWQQHRLPEDRHSLRVMVMAINEHRAAEIVERGFRFSDRPDWTSHQVAEELAAARVDVRIELDYRVETTGRDGTAAAVVPVTDETPRQEDGSAAGTDDEPGGVRRRE